MAQIGALFVCLGNICRSPVAEALFRKKVNEAGLTDYFRIDSAGTGRWHEGETADGRSISVAEKRGVKVDSRARQIRPRDLFEFEYILTMEKSVQEYVEKMARSRTEANPQVLLMRDFDPDARGLDEVPDPYNGDMKDFEDMYEILDRATHAFLQSLLPQLKNR